MPFNKISGATLHINAALGPKAHIAFTKLLRQKLALDFKTLIGLSKTNKNVIGLKQHFLMPAYTLSCWAINKGPLR